MRVKLYWTLFATTLGVYALMLGWTLPTVSGHAGGLAPFDMRPGGYSFAEAREFLLELTEGGRRFYLDIQQRLDVLYPALLALTMFFSLEWLAPVRWKVSWWLIACVAAPVALFDYLENHAVAAIVERGAMRMTPEAVQLASQWTSLKSGATTVAMSLILTLVVFRVVEFSYRRWQGRAQSA